MGCNKHPWVPWVLVPEARLSSSPSFNTSLLQLVQFLGELVFIFPLFLLIPLWRGGFEASSRPSQVRKCHCPPACAVIRAGWWEGH